MIELVIKANRPELSDSSLKQYLSSLRTLNDKKPIQDIDFLKDYDTVMEKLSSKKPTTVKNYMNAIIVVLSAVKADTELIDKYTKTRDELNQQYSDEQATHQKSEAQEKNWVSFDEYKDMVKHLEESTNGLRKQKEWNETDQRNFQEYLLTKL
eukprot:COSAG02_NODE_30675_length_547_cov_0.805804_1_plen_152_part_01